MGCNCKKNKTRVLTPKMLQLQREAQARTEKEEQDNGQKD